MKKHNETTSPKVARAAAKWLRRLGKTETIHMTYVDTKGELKLITLEGAELKEFLSPFGSALTQKVKTKKKTVKS